MTYAAHDAPLGLALASLTIVPAVAIAGFWVYVQVRNAWKTIDGTIARTRTDIATWHDVFEDDCTHPPLTACTRCMDERNPQIAAELDAIKAAEDHVRAYDKETNR